MSHDLRTITREIQILTGADDDGIYGLQTATMVLDALKHGTRLPAQATPKVSALLDERTLKNLRTLEPGAQTRFEPFILRAKAIAGSLGYDYIAISGTRGKEEQDALYAKGRTTAGSKVTNAKYGYSNHNFGIALDFGVFKSGKYLDNSDPNRAAEVHRAVASAAKGYGIDWGGNWKSFKDIPHFEVATSLTTAEKRSRLFAGKPILS